MIIIAKERCQCHNAEFSVCDVQKLVYANEFDVITAIQVNHYLHMDERQIALQNIYRALKDNGVFVSFEIFAPFTDLGKTVYLEKWKAYQIRQGKSLGECEKHIKRYGEDYFPISVSENMELMRNCGFKAVEILWLSNMQDAAGFEGYCFINDEYMKLPALTKEQLDRTAVFIEEVHHLAFDDVTVMNIVYEEAEGYFRG